MSLATTSGMSMGGGGVGGGGLVMAHQANAMGRPAAQPPPQASVPHGSAGLPPSAAALGADLLDKQQSLSLKQVRDLSHLPIVSIDLFAKDPHVAMFSPKPKDTSNNAATASIVGKMKGEICLKSTEAAHKTFRKWLTKSKPFSAVQSDALTKSDDDSAIKIERPQQWLGLRRISEAPEFIRSAAAVESSSKHAIAEESSQDAGVTFTDGTLDGSVPQGDDFDRVLCKVRLHSSKKALTVLPEEAVQLLLHQAQYHVARKVKASEDDEEIEEYPYAIAAPAWACHDAAMESLLDAASGNGVVYQRSIAALAGALKPGADGKPNSLLEEINKVRVKMQKEFQVKKAKDPEASMKEDTLVVLMGMAHDGFECTAVEISELQPSNLNCIFGNFRVLSNISCQHKEPESVIQSSVEKMRAALQKIAPEAEAPAVVVTYGSPHDQKIIQEKWNATKNNLGSWDSVTFISTKAECVALGTAILGGVSHGRTSVVSQAPGSKPKAILGIRVQNVSPVAVGIQMNYHGGAAKKWTPVKTIFDFDRRVPAGPYPVELKASDCVVYRNGGAELSDEQFLKASKDKEGAKNIPQREAAALDLRVQVLQKWSRDGDWKKVGDPKKPLVVNEETDDDSDGNEVACESVVLELSLGATGIITADLLGDRQSVVQATKSARNSTIRYYVGIGLAIAFFGGFLVKSYWEERVFERDTRRLLLYYKKIIPGSMQDGDEHNARYLVWKYRGKKNKLWRTLEKKYGSPVPELHEFEFDEDEASEDSSEEPGNEKDEPDL